MEHSDSEETSIIAFKRVKCGDWASDMPRRQETSYEAIEGLSEEELSEEELSEEELSDVEVEAEAWPVDQSISINADPKSGVVPSSYWSVPEQCAFYNYLRYFGTDWHSIAETMKTRTHIMVRKLHV